jgi:hypothetical protein
LHTEFLTRPARTGDDATTIDIQRASCPLQAAVDRFVADLRDAADDFAGEVP